MEIINILLTVTFIIVIKLTKKEKNKPRIIGYNPTNGRPVFDSKPTEKPIGYDPYTGVPIYDERKLKNKKILTEEDKSKIANTILMITGASLIMIAAIVFLISSWEVTSGLLKTIILILLQIVFIGFYYASSKIFKLDKASKIFKDLALLFIPIILISLSSFELIGTYLSTGGDGENLYLGITFLISDIIYRIYGKLKEDKTIKVYAFVSEVLAILSLTAFISEVFEYMLIVLSIYNIIYYILLQGNFLDKDYTKPNNILSYILVAYTVFGLCIKVPNMTLMHLNILIYSIYFFIRQNKEKDETNQKVFTILYLSCYFFFLGIISTITISPYFIYIIALIPLLLLSKIIKNKNIQDLLMYGVGVAGVLIILSSLFNSEKTVYYLLTFVSGTILYSVLYYINKHPIFKYASYVLFTSIFMDLCYITGYNDLIKYVPLLTIILSYSLEVVIESLKDEYSKICFLIAIAFESLLLTENYAVIITLIMAICLVKIEKLNEFSLMVPLLCSLSIFEMENSIYTKIASIILIGTYTALSILKKEFNVYTIISFISIILSKYLFELHNIVLSILIIVWSILHIIINIKNRNKFYEIMAVLGFLDLYISIFQELEVTINCVYPLGLFIAIIVITRFIIKGENGIKNFFEYFSIMMITVTSSNIITDSVDSLLFIFILLLICMISFIVKWTNYGYASLISMVASVIYVITEFWGAIPWYVYILFVGFTLIILAMVQEKRKDKKEVQNK